MAKRFELSLTNRIDQQFSIKLISVETNGLARLELLEYSEVVNALPSNMVATNHFGSGLQLLSSSYSNQTVELLGLWPELETRP